MSSRYPLKQRWLPLQSEPPRVVFITDSIYPFRIGGKEERHSRLISEHVAAGITVDVFTMKSWIGPRTIRREGVTYHGICRQWPMYRDHRRSILQALLFSLSSLRVILHRFDVLEVDATPVLPVLAAWLVCRTRRRRMIATHHEVWSYSYWQEYAGPIIGTVGYLSQDLCVRLSDVAVGVSQETGAKLKARTKRQVVVAENAVDVKILGDVEPHGPRADVLYVGRLRPHKRVDLLIRSISSLCDLDHRPSVRIVGTGTDQKRLRDLTNELGLSDCVVFQEPWVDKREYVSALKSCRLLVMPSSREGSCITSLEAACVGVPIVMATDVENVAQFHLDPTMRRSVVPATVECFAEAIRYWLEHPAPQSETKEAHRTWVECATEIRSTCYGWPSESLGLPEGHLGAINGPATLKCRPIGASAA